MHYAILRHAKIKAPLMGAAVAHNHRTSKVEKCNIDAALTPLNQVMKGQGTVAERLADKLKVLTTKVRKDAVVAVELVLSASPEWFDGLAKDRTALHGHPKFREWVNATMKWARGEFGQNIVDVSLHMDESSPHMHLLAVPLTTDGRLCAKEVTSRAQMIRRQDSYASAMEGFGLSRGDPAKETKRRHIKLTEKPQGGGKASELAAQLADALKENAILQKRVADLRRHAQSYAKDLQNTEAELEGAKFQLQRLKDLLAEKEGTREIEPEEAMARFIDQHKKLPWLDDKQAAVGTLVASEGRFVVLHLGRGKHGLYECDSPEQVKEFSRGQDRGRDSGPSR
jgi:ribosomal protein S15P/S13E